MQHLTKKVTEQHLTHKIMRHLTKYCTKSQTLAGSHKIHSILGEKNAAAEQQQQQAVIAGSISGGSSTPAAAFIPVPIYECTPVENKKYLKLELDM